MFGVASCHVNSTVQTDINTDVSSSEITESQTEPETVPPETTTELAPITVATTAASTSVETKEETTTTTTEETTATEKVIKDLSPEWVRALSQAQDLGTNQMLIVAASGMDKTTCKVCMSVTEKVTGFRSFPWTDM